MAAAAIGRADIGGAALWCSNPVRMPMSIIMTRNSRHIIVITPVTVGAFVLRHRRLELYSGVVRHPGFCLNRHRLWDSIIILIRIAMCIITGDRIIIGAIIRDIRRSRRGSGMVRVPVGCRIRRGALPNGAAPVVIAGTAGKISIDSH